MILHALCDYYQRKKDDLPGDGFEQKEIHFLIVLRPDGSFLHIEDMREGEGKRRRGKVYRVPQAVKKSVNVASNLLWGNAEYVLGQPDAKKLEEQRRKGKEKHYRTRLIKMHATFKSEIGSLPDQAKNSIEPVLSFLSGGHFEAVLADPYWQQIQASSANISFKLVGQEMPIFSNAEVLASIKQSGRATGERRTCLITGETDVVERLHPPLKGVWGAQTSGANIVSFNLPPFNSFGLERGANAPIGKHAAFAYTTALNHLLASSQRIQIGDASTVFWASMTNPMESLLLSFFDEPPKDDPDQGTNAVKALFQAPYTGTPSFDDDGTNFYVLGLAAPSKARLTVRFWHVSTVGELARHIRRHFVDLHIDRPKYVDSPFLSLKALLKALAQRSREHPDGDIDKLPPNLAGDFMKTILAGSAYPQTLLQAALRRIHAEQAKKDDKTGKHREQVTYARAALIKAWLNSQTRNTDQKGEIDVSLDESNTNIGYRLGRLFAVLEKVQEEANPGINTTIRDSYFGSASSTPSAVFSTLMRRNQHHMTKLRKEKPGLYVTRDKLIQAICNAGIDGRLGFSPFLSLADQGRFVIGYYQQRQDFFKS